MLQRISAAISAGRRAAAAVSVQGRPANGAELPVTASWALIHVGDPAGLGPRLTAHLDACKARGFRCILVADDIPQLCVGSREIVFEFLPLPARTALSTPGGFAAATDHSFRRLSQILTFWQVVGCDWEGASAREFLDQAPDWAHPALHAMRATKGNPSKAGEHMIALA
jgi:hypothetical protein